MLTDILLNSSLALAVTVPILVALDVLLDDIQKDEISRQTVRLWAWLDDVRQHSLLNWLRRNRSWVTSTAIVLALAYTVWVARSGPEISDLDVGFFLFSGSFLIAGVWLGLKMIHLTLNARTLFRALLRATLFVVVVLSPFYAVGYGMTYFRHLLTPSGEPTVLQMLTVILFIVTTLFTGLLLIFWATVAIPVACVYTLTVVVAVVEYVVRRMAEYSKGPILAVSVLLGSILVVIKAFK